MPGTEVALTKDNVNPHYFHLYTLTVQGKTWPLKAMGGKNIAKTISLEDLRGSGNYQALRAKSEDGFECYVVQAVKPRQHTSAARGRGKAPDAGLSRAPPIAGQPQLPIFDFTRLPSLPQPSSSTLHRTPPATPAARMTPPLRTPTPTQAKAKTSRRSSTPGM